MSPSTYGRMIKPWGESVACLTTYHFRITDAIVSVRPSHLIIYYCHLIAVNANKVGAEILT